MYLPFPAVGDFSVHQCRCERSELSPSVRTECCRHPSACPIECRPQSDRGIFEDASPVSDENSARSGVIEHGSGRNESTQEVHPESLLTDREQRCRDEYVGDVECFVGFTICNCLALLKSYWFDIFLGETPVS